MQLLLWQRADDAESCTAHLLVCGCRGLEAHFLLGAPERIPGEPARALELCVEKPGVLRACGAQWHGLVGELSCAFLVFDAGCGGVAGAADCAESAGRNAYERVSRRAGAAVCGLAFRAGPGSHRGHRAHRGGAGDWELTDVV